MKRSIKGPGASIDSGLSHALERAMRDRADMDMIMALWKIDQIASRRAILSWSAPVVSYRGASGSLRGSVFNIFRRMQEDGVACVRHFMHMPMDMLLKMGILKGREALSAQKG